MSESLKRAPSRRSSLVRAGAGVVLASAFVVAAATTASAAPPYVPAPDLIPALGGFSQLWQADGTSASAETSANDLHGTVQPGAAGALRWNDQLAVWINNNATSAQQLRALQDSAYNNATGTAYDQSLTISTALGSVLGPLYVKGIESGQLPKTQALINDSTGTAGAFVGTGGAKAYFSYPRPYLPTDPNAAPVAGDAAGCAANATNAGTAQPTPQGVNGSSLAALRIGTPYADAKGNLAIRRVAPVTDTTHQFSPNDVTLDAGYQTTGICLGGAFPSGHTTTAYENGVTLATLLPELAPEILARASEGGNDRIVLGVHYPLDIVGGRIDGELALATRWSDAAFRTDVLEPARTELVGYLQQQCGGTLLQCIARQKPYTDNPYGGKRIPGGTAQVVTDRASALAVYTERLTYGFAPVGRTTLAPAVPAGADKLLLTAFPTLTDAQRTSILAQTEIRSGQPLDLTSTGNGSWERLNLAAALSASVKVGTNGSVSVVRTGGQPQVIKTGSLQVVGAAVAAPGGTLTLSGSGFVAGQQVTLVLHSTTPVTLGTATADARGRLVAAVTIPRGAAVGHHAIDATDESGSSLLVRPLTIVVTPVHAAHSGGHGSGPRWS